MQNGSIMRSERRRGPDVWEYRWREPGADGKRKHRRMVVGSVNQFRDKAAVFRATSALAPRHQYGQRCDAKESPSLSRSWRITMASANLHPAIVGRLTPPKWAIEATCESGSFRDGAGAR